MLMSRWSSTNYGTSPRPSSFPVRFMSTWPVMRATELFRARPRAIAFTAVGAILTWLVLSQSFGAYLAAVAPQVALWLDPRQSEALVNLADQALSAADLVQADAGPQDDASNLPNQMHGDKHQAVESPAASLLDRAFLSFESLGKDQSISRPIAPRNAPAVRDWATIALLNDPLDARALRILGQLAEADGDDAKTAKFMDAANRLSLHEMAAVFWLLRNNAATGDFKSAVYYADIMLRV